MKRGVKGMEAAALASGSSGNCFYVGDWKTGLLVDAGISAKQIVSRLIALRINPEKVKAIFITHEHIDHVRGADVLARKLGIPIYATKATADNSFLCSDEKLIKIIARNKVIKVGDLQIEAFSKSHSAGDPVSFTISAHKKVSVITDAGYTCANIKKHVADCDFLFMEANHDEKMLEKGPYPAFLKEWIRSDEGHLSNSEAAKCIAEHASEKLKNIVLSHLSETNNTRAVALKTFEKILAGNASISPELMVSTRERPTELFRI